MNYIKSHQNYTSCETTFAKVHLSHVHVLLWF